VNETSSSPPRSSSGREKNRKYFHEMAGSLTEFPH